MTTNKKKIGLRAALRLQRSASVRAVAANISKGLCIGLLASSFVPQRAVAAGDAAPLFNLNRPSSALEGSAHEVAVTLSSFEAQTVAEHRLKRANFELERASREARYVADWVVDSGDNRSLPFAIVDKTDAKVFVFEANGRLRGAAPALLGLARGDDAVPGIGDRALSSIRPGERTTPAGRFVAALDRNARGKEILWVDYDGAVSMHPVVTSKPEEHRAVRCNPERRATRPASLKLIEHYRCARPFPAPTTRRGARRGLMAALESAIAGNFRRNMILLNMPTAGLPQDTHSRSARHGARV